MSKPKSNAGRPSVYEKRIKPHLEKINTLRENGFNHEDIAQMLGIARSTYFKHKAEIEEFSDSLKNSDGKLISQLEDSLYKRALGKAVKKTRTVETYGNGKKKIIEREEDVIASDVAIFFALTNLAPDKWKHKQDIQLSTEDELPTFADVMKEAYKKVID